MSTGEHRDPRSGPAGGLSQAQFGGFDALAKGYEPALRGVSRWNLEVFGLATRRTQAWMEIPVRLSQCRTTLDVFNAQLQFWQSAAHDYAEGSRKLAMAFGAFAVVPGFNGAWRGEAAAPTRDYISVPEHAEPAASPARKSSDRRAA